MGTLRAGIRVAGSRAKELFPAATVDPSLVLTVGFPLLAVAVGVWTYRDARRRGWEEWAPLVGFAIGGLFLAGSVPGLVALAVGEDAAVQGFPTALRVVPGFAALGVYLYFR